MAKKKQSEDENQKLTLKQQIFVVEYLKDFNGTRAAIAAGYSENSATALAYETLRKPYIKKAISKKVKELLDDTELLTLQWLNQIKNIAMFDLRKAADWSGDNVQLKSSDEIDDETAAAIQEVSYTASEFGGNTKIKAESKIKALDMLGKYLSLYNDSIDLNANVTISFDSEDEQL